MKSVGKLLYVVMILTMVFSMAACAPAATARARCPLRSRSARGRAPPPPRRRRLREKTYKDLVVGFAQIGAESGWRDGETNSIKDTAAKLGVNLKFSDAQQKQENQIKAVRSFIAQKVDVIGIPPVVTTGFETVFKEAKDAGIPVIFVDRKADVPEDYYATFIGSDFVLEGKNAAIEMAKLLGEKGSIIELEGTVGAGPAIDRKKGFDDEMAANHKDITILNSSPVTSTWPRAKKLPRL